MRFHHCDRVRIGGFGGPRGIVLRCEKRSGSGHYFKIKMDTGEWIWPDGFVVVDSSGSYEVTCSECGGAFRTNYLADALCPNCDRREQRPNESAYEIRKYGAVFKRSGSRR